jgi:outer membrane protein TolC
MHGKTSCTHSVIVRYVPLLIALVLSATAINSGAAAPAHDPLVLSIDDAVQLALSRNEELLIAKQDLARAEGAVQEAWSGALPSLALQAIYQGNFQKPAFFVPEGLAGDDGGNTKVEIGGDVEVQGSLRLDQVLYAFGRVGNAVKYADIFRNIASAGIDRARSDVVVATEKAYFTVLFMQRLVEIQNQSLRQARAHFDNVEMQFNQGSASRFTFQRAKVEVKNREPALIRAENSLRLAFNDLQRVIGVDHEAVIVLRDTLGFTPVVLDRHTALETGLQNRPELRAMRLNVEGKKRVLSIYRANIYPTLGLFGQVLIQGQASRDNWFEPLSKENRQISVQGGVGFSMPVFDGFKTRGQVEQARADMRKAEFELLQAERAVTLDIIKAVQDLEGLLKEYEAQVATVDLAEDAYAIAKARFENGLSTLVELNDTELAMELSRTSLAETLYRYNVALANYRRAIGDSSLQPSDGGDLPGYRSIHEEQE